MNERRHTSSADQYLERNALWISIAAVAVLAVMTVAAIASRNTDVWINILLLVAGIAAIGMARTGRSLTANWIVIGIITVSIFVEVLTHKGTGINQGMTAIVLVGGIVLTAMPRRLVGRALVLSLFIGIAVILMDVFGSAGRTASTPSALQWGVAVLATLAFIFFLAKEFPLLDLRAKIALGILVTGGIALGTLSFVALERAGEITNSLSHRLETSVRLLAEEQLVNTAYIQADLANQFFEGIKNEVDGLVEQRVALQSRQDILSRGTYWDAATSLIKLKGGQYGNLPSDDTSSVFVPVNVPINENVIAELNTSAYLDFSSPQILKSRPEILAIYYIDTQGVVRYYPNVELASLLPPDFDATSRPYYEITSPLFNPQKRTRWTIPYVDAAGGGLVVTVASPVYFGDEFHGVVAADMQLSRITEQLASIKIGQTGYAFMVDDAGRIISMPPAGYELYGINPQDLPAEEYFKQTVLGEGSNELKSITYRMAAGGNGLNVIQINGVETYISYAPVKANGYSIALVVPVSEMQSAITVARNETESQVQSAIRIAAFILIALLIGAVVVSVGLGQVIAAPVMRLTQTANRIVEGNLGAQAMVASKDEIGTLAQAFNSMTSRLRETLSGLEQIVEERTAQLVTANERNERRARQFEAIAHVAHTISSTRELDSLLAEITTSINREFGFYHIGIFLVDRAREFAILSAANSEGGQAMLARGHRLKVGEQGLVGYVTGTGMPRVALDTGTDAVFLNNPDLPETRSEITLPLLAGEEIIGALDVQSDKPNAFSQEDVNILSSLADQVSIAIQNAKQFEETRKALAESEALSRQFIQTGWQQFTKRQQLTGVHHSGVKATLLHKKNGRDESQLGTGQLKGKGRGAVLSMPVKLRGEVIGSVEVRAPDNRQWDQDEMDIVSTIIERAAIALENARLLAETQKRAAKERAIGEISAKISALSDIDDLLKTAAQELGRTLPGAEVAIQLKKDETE
jgi:GAF domain-containing protein/HAMP domain-containing protein